MGLIKKVLLFLLLSSVGLGSGITLYVFTSIPVVNFNKKLAQSARIYDTNGTLLDEVHGEEHRIIVNSKNISPNLKAAVVAIEDENFYKHSGVSIKGVGRAVNEMAKTSVASGKLTANEGASTINMQLAKNLNGDIFERNLVNKVIETIQAIKLDRTYTKDVILTKYLNTIYWGNNTYGVEAASNTYFGKSADKLNVAEASMLAALIQNPSRYDPYHGNYSALKQRQKLVLKKMSSNYSKCIVEKELPKKDRVTKYNSCVNEWVNKISTEPLVVSGKTTWQKSKAPFVTEAAMKEVKKQLKLNAEDLETGGYRIVTTVDYDVQKKAEEAVKKGSAWKGEAQIGLVSIDIKSNKIRATVGSKDYNISGLNRSMESARQPGSSIKPFVYYTYFEQGHTSDELIDDAPVCFSSLWEEYCPKNYGGSFSGVDSIYNHLIKSRNIPALIVGQRAGIGNVISNMKKLGFTTKLEDIVSFPLGSNDVKPVEMANAYAAFANGGKWQPYTIINSVSDTSGKIYIDNTKRGPGKQVLNASAVKKLNNVLYGVVERGTGTAARIPGLIQGAKTGTTSGEADVWFVGFTGNISTAVWIGNDNYHRKLGSGATGGSWAAPIYRDFVAAYYNK